MFKYMLSVPPLHPVILSEQQKPRDNNSKKYWKAKLTGNVHVCRSALVCVHVRMSIYIREVDIHVLNW